VASDETIVVRAAIVAAGGHRVAAVTAARGATTAAASRSRRVPQTSAKITSKEKAGPVRPAFKRSLCAARRLLNLDPIADDRFAGVGGQLDGRRGSFDGQHDRLGHHGARQFLDVAVNRQHIAGVDAAGHA